MVDSLIGRNGPCVRRTVQVVTDIVHDSVTAQHQNAAVNHAQDHLLRLTNVTAISHVCILQLRNMMV